LRPISLCLFLIACVSALGSCQSSSRPVNRDIANGPVAKIRITQDGVVSLDDKTVSLDELKAALSTLKQSSGSSVWYYRENAAAQPHPNAMEALRIIVAAKLPIRLSTKPDFSDFVGADGRSHPMR
jgi:biopolymer transport protein ExbD